MNQGERIKKIFSYYGKTITDYADFLGKHKSNISKKIKLGSFDEAQLLSFSTFLKIPLEELKEQMTYDPDQTDYVQKLESENEILRELRDSLKQTNIRNDKLLAIQEKQIKDLEDQLRKKEKDH